MHDMSCNCRSCLIRAGYRPEQILTCPRIPCDCKAGKQTKECGLGEIENRQGLSDLAGLGGLYQNSSGVNPN